MLIHSNHDFVSIVIYVYQKNESISREFLKCSSYFLIYLFIIIIVMYNSFLVHSIYLFIQETLSILNVES